MVRVLLGLTLAGALFALMLSDPPTASAQKGGNSGTVAKVNPKTGAIAINMVIVAKKKREQTDKEFFLNDDAKVTITDGGETKTMTGKEALESGAIKEGARVTFVPDGDLKIKELTVGGVGKKK
jgi:hypothetical protein